MTDIVILETSSLTKAYSEGKGAIDINISLNKGEIVGFIGPNGAGKTTTMRMITGLIHKDGGLLTVFGKNITSEQGQIEAMQRIGFLPSEGGLYEEMNSKDTFEYAAKLYGKNAFETAMSLAKRLKLDTEQTIKRLSFGNRRKVGFILSIMHSPDIIILDEPTSGLDPLIQHEVLKILKEMKEKGISILLSSHVLAEVQSICDRIYMIKDAKIVYSGKTKELLTQALKEITIISPSKTQQKQILEQKYVEEHQIVGDDLVIYTADIKACVTFLLSLSISEFYIERPTLEKMFINLY